MICHADVTQQRRIIDIKRFYKSLKKQFVIFFIVVYILPVISTRGYVVKMLREILFLVGAPVTF